VAAFIELRAGGMVMYERFLLRRLFATLLDLTFATLLTSLLIWPLAYSLDSPFRVSNGLFFKESCKETEAYTSKNVPFSKEGWDRISVCDRLTDGLFPSRTAEFYKKTVNGVTTTSKSVLIPLNSKNEARAVFDVDQLSIIVLVLLVAVLESSHFQTSPGKRLFKLKVVTASGERIRFSAALMRNFLKYSFGVFIFAVALVAYFALNNQSLSVFQIENPIVKLDGQTLAAIMFYPMIFGLINFVDWVSFLLPWSKAGRALHDRWADSYVRKLD
jgi:uncharacterized RDD family membrane protein YckC